MEVQLQQNISGHKGPVTCPRTPLPPSTRPPPHNASPGRSPIIPTSNTNPLSAPACFSQRSRRGLSSGGRRRERLWVQGGISSRPFKSCPRSAAVDCADSLQCEPVAGKSATALEAACVILVRKTLQPKDRRRYNLVVLTFDGDEEAGASVLDFCPLVSSLLDPLLFAYQPGTGVESSVELLFTWKSCRAL